MYATLYDGGMSFLTAKAALDCFAASLMGSAGAENLGTLCIASASTTLLACGPGASWLDLPWPSEQGLTAAPLEVWLLIVFDNPIHE